MRRAPGSIVLRLAVMFIGAVTISDPSCANATDSATRTCVPILPWNSVEQIGFLKQEVICDLGADLKVFNTVDRTWTCIPRDDRTAALNSRPGIRWPVRIHPDNEAFDVFLMFRHTGMSVFPGADYGSGDDAKNPSWVFGNTGHRSNRPAFVDVRKRRGYTIASQFGAHHIAPDGNKAWIGGSGRIGEADLISGRLIAHRTLPDLATTMGACRVHDSMYLLDSRDGLIRIDLTTGILKVIPVLPANEPEAPSPIFLGMTTDKQVIYFMFQENVGHSVRLCILDPSLATTRFLDTGIEYANCVRWVNGVLYGFGSEHAQFDDFSEDLEYWSRGGCFTYEPASGKLTTLTREAVTGLAPEPLCIRTLGPTWEPRYRIYSEERRRLIRITDQVRTADCASRLPPFKGMEELDTALQHERTAEITETVRGLCVVPLHRKDDWERIQIIQR